MTNREKYIQNAIEELMDFIKDLREENRKQQEILDILKRTKLDLWDFKHNMEASIDRLVDRTPYEWYSMHYMEFSREMLSQEEFDLVWEWLNDR